MRFLSFFGLCLLLITSALSENPAKSEWRRGMNFKQQVYKRQGLWVEKVDGDYDSSVGIYFGSQNATNSDAEGTRRVRKVVDSGTDYVGGISIDPKLIARRRNFQRYTLLNLV